MNGEVAMEELVAATDEIPAVPNQRLLPKT
jgi:hypothetical protein